MCRWRQASHASVGSGGDPFGAQSRLEDDEAMQQGFTPRRFAGSGMQPPRSGRYPSWPDVLARLLLAASLLASQSSARKNLVVDGPFPLTDLSGRGPRGATRRGGLGRMPFSEAMLKELEGFWLEKGERRIRLVCRSCDAVAGWFFWHLDKMST